MRDAVIGVAFAGLIVLLATALTMWAITVTSERDAYEKCVASIPGYLDAQEILYAEQECDHG
jgi:hypothetical protein